MRAKTPESPLEYIVVCLPRPVLARRPSHPDSPVLGDSHFRIFPLDTAASRMAAVARTVADAATEDLAATSEVRSLQGRQPRDARWPPHQSSPSSLVRYHSSLRSGNHGAEVLGLTSRSIEPLRKRRANTQATEEMDSGRKRPSRGLPLHPSPTTSIIRHTLVELHLRAESKAYLMDLGRCGHIENFWDKICDKIKERHPALDVKELQAFVEGYEAKGAICLYEHSTAAYSELLDVMEVAISALGACTLIVDVATSMYVGNRD